ncbi:MAG: YceI family protein [Candidatus Woesearchaeota archaeon]
MKNIYIITIALLSLVVIAGCSRPPEDIERADIGDVTGSAITQYTDEELDAIELTNEQKSFEFEGYGVGRSHVGTFTEHSVTVFYAQGSPVKINAVIYADSVSYSSERLVNHLKSEDFFHVEVYPTIEFSSLTLHEDTMTGDLTFLGVTREITIPLERTENTIATNFLLDTEQFGMSYTGVNSEVRIAFELEI